MNSSDMNAQAAFGTTLEAAKTAIEGFQLVMNCQEMFLQIRLGATVVATLIGVLNLPAPSL